MESILDTETIVLLIFSAFVIYRLYVTLGSRTGNERPPDSANRGPNNGSNDLGHDPTNELGRIVNKPDANNADGAEILRPDFDSAQNQNGMPVLELADSSVEEISDELRQILAPVLKADQNFSPAGFVEGASMAYENILDAYVKGDVDYLKNRLNEETLQNFGQSIADIKRLEQTFFSKLVSIESAKIVHSDYDKSHYFVSVEFGSEMIRYTKDKAGELLDGDLSDITEFEEIWTFSRDGRARNSDWILVGIETP